MPVNSHYVPQFILRHFGERISCYNIQTKEFLYDRDPGSVFSEIGYYPDDVEKKLNEKAENQFSKVLNDLLEKDEIRLTRADMLQIKRFLLITWIRSKAGIVGTEHILNCLKETLKTHPELLLTFPCLLSEAVSNESPYDYWIRSIRCVLDDETGDPRILRGSENVTSSALFWSEAFMAGYITFWDAPSEEEFMVTDSGMAREDEIGFDEEMMNHRKLDVLKEQLAKCNQSDKRHIDELKKMIAFNSRFFSNFYFFPVSSKRLIVLANPYFKHVHENVDELQARISQLPNADHLMYGVKYDAFNRITSFSRPELTTPNRAECRIAGRLTDEDVFTYRPILLEPEEVHVINALIIGNTCEWIGFGDETAVRPSLESLLECLPEPKKPTLCDLCRILEHADDPDYLKKEDSRTVTATIEKLGVPDRYRSLIGRRVGASLISSQISKGRYTDIAAVLVLFRYGLLELSSDYDQDTILDSLQKLDVKELRSLARQSPGSDSCEFDRCVGAVFCEVEARRGDGDACQRIGRNYLEGKHVPLNYRRAEYYLFKALDHGKQDAGVLLVRLLHSEGVSTSDIESLISNGKEPPMIERFVLGRQYYQDGDTEKGLEYMIESARHGYSCAYYTLAKLYLDESAPCYDPGKGVRTICENLERYPALGTLLTDSLEKHPEYYQRNEAEIVGALGRMEEAGHRDARRLRKVFEENYFFDNTERTLR